MSMATSKITRSPLTPDERKKVLKLWRTGIMSGEDIAQTLGLSEIAVWEALPKSKGE